MGTSFINLSYVALSNKIKLFNLSLTFPLDHFCKKDKEKRHMLILIFLYGACVLLVYITNILHSRCITITTNWGAMKVPCSFVITLLPSSWPFHHLLPSFLLGLYPLDPALGSGFLAPYKFKVIVLTAKCYSMGVIHYTIIIFFP